MGSEASKTTGEAIKTQTLNKQQLKTNTTLKSVTINFPKTQNPPTVMRKITVTWPPEKENPWLIVFLEKVNRWPKMLVTKRYSYLRSAIMILDLKHDRVPGTSITNPWIKLSTIETYLTEASLEHAKALIDMYWKCRTRSKKNFVTDFALAVGIHKLVHDIIVDRRSNYPEMTTWDRNFVEKVVVIHRGE